MPFPQARFPSAQKPSVRRTWRLLICIQSIPWLSDIRIGVPDPVYLQDILIATLVLEA